MKRAACRLSDPAWGGGTVNAHEKEIQMIRIALFAASAAVVAIGVKRGGPKAVFHEALSVCLACIGIR